MYKSRIYFKILDPYTTIVYIYLIDASKIVYSFEIYCNICCKKIWINNFQKRWMDCVEIQLPWFWIYKKDLRLDVGGVNTRFQITLDKYKPDQVYHYYDESVSSNEELEALLKFI